MTTLTKYPAGCTVLVRSFGTVRGRMVEAAPVRAIVVGPYLAGGPDDLRVRRDDGVVMAVRPLDLVGLAS